MSPTMPAPCGDETLGAFLEWTTAAYAPRPALRYGLQSGKEIWTYADLRRQADRVSRWLLDEGVRTGDRVVLWAPNGPWWVAAFFGALRIGAVVVPLDVRSGPDFVRRVVEQTEPKLALVSSTIAVPWGDDLRTFAVEELDSHLPTGGPSTWPEVRPDDLAEVMFTSGTTGAPKGVMLTHRNIRTNVEACNDVLPSGEALRPLSILPLSHLFEQTVGLLLPLRGGTNIAYATALQPAAIQRDMEEYRVTTMLLVPRVLHLFMDAIEREVAQQGREKTWKRLLTVAEYLPRRGRKLLFRAVLQRFGGKLDFFVTGGAQLDPELEQKWELLGIAILQGYGSTETAPVIASTSLRDRRSRSVGKPVPGVQIRLAPDGELLVKGPNVTPGYWKNPEATAAALEDGWYRTGDIAELDAEGRIYLRGRKKDIIVLANGLNVYPDDVEEALRRVPGVAEVVVVGLPTSSGPEVHAVILSEAGCLDLAEAVGSANRQLAHHQRIRSYRAWTQPDFPRTHTGKVKRADVLSAVIAEHQAPVAAGRAGG